MTVDKEAVRAALRAEDVVAHLAIPGQWRGRWLRSRRCATDDHGTDAFGIARDGFWHCFACDKGGDLLALVAASEKLDVRRDLPAVLELAAKIAGVDTGDPWDAIGRPAPKERPPIPPAVPLEQRITLAKRRAAWVWGRLSEVFDARQRRANGEMKALTEMYLEDRCIDFVQAGRRDHIKETPLRVTMQEIAQQGAELKSLAYLFASPGIAVPVRGLDGAMVDIRVRRLEPRPDQPKIIGMLGGVTSGPAENGRPRQLVGCYGHPENGDGRDLAVVVEGLADYLTALCVWPDAWVLGAVEAGSLSLVVAHAARKLAESGDGGRLIIVEQSDPPRLRDDGTTRIGAADASVNEDPNAATKVAVRILGPKRVGWLMCTTQAHIAVDGGPTVKACKDLNDLIRLGVDAKALVVWWTEIGQAA